MSVNNAGHFYVGTHGVCVEFVSRIWVAQGVRIDTRSESEVARPDVE